MRQIRRLAAILAADVAGYSQLTEAHEEGAGSFQAPEMLRSSGIKTS